MYRVVVIDDEPRIVEGLTKGLEWEKWNCKVIGTAGDGEEGIGLIHKEKPDIVITDISMPKVDGLTMLAALKSEFPAMQITILTGFRDFEYARRAIELGVTRFLLKPSKFDELEEAIGIMTERLLASNAISTSDAISNRSSSDVEEKQVELDQDEADEHVAFESAANSFIVKQALAYMREHYNEKLRLSDVADEVYVSQWHLSKLLNKTTGQNFSELLNAIRMEKAAELLRDPHLRISDIAEQVGFVDLAHFSRVFKKVEGMSANEYRNRLG